MMAIQRHPKRPRWYRVPFDVSEPLWGVPGTYFEGGQITAHQTHLPLLDPALVDHLRAKNDQSVEVWASRDAWCAERGFKPRVTQQQAVDFARDRGGVFLVDDPRLGKTLSALLMDEQWREAFAGRLPYGPLVIIAPLKTRAVWLGWARRMFPGTEIGVITGKTFDKETLQKPIVFGHYDVIHKWMALFQIGTLILDEVQCLTNHRADRTKAVKVLSLRARHVVACTGTPINRYPSNLFAILEIIEPGAWGSYFDFCQRYADPKPGSHGWTYDGLTNEAELAARLSEIMLRRRWRDCYADLPPITRSVVVAEVSQAERNKLDIIAGKLKAERSNVASNLAAYRRQVSAVKLPTVLREVEAVLDRGVPAVVWTWHKELAEKLAKKLGELERPSWVIHGDILIPERERRMDAWREHPAGVLVATMAVADVGIDLSHGQITPGPVAIFAEIDWTPPTIGQAEMRTFDASRPMDVRFVIANHVVDQRMVRSLVSKLSASDPLGVAAAIDAINALRDAVLGPQDDGDLDRLLEDLLASA